jgi:hypothetical protein
MRKLEPKEKERRRVAIPEEMRDAFVEVFQRIEQAKRDPDINISYDDAIQFSGLCGGRSRKSKRPFGFTWHPPGLNKRSRWYLALHRLEIEDIADGRMIDILMYCCTSPDCQMKFREPDEHCFYCDYIDD